MHDNPDNLLDRRARLLPTKFRKLDPPYIGNTKVGAFDNIGASGGGYWPEE